MDRRDGDSDLYTYGFSAVRGLFTDPHIGKLPDAHKSARRWAVFGIVCGLIWVFGYTSIVAIAAGAFSWTEYRRAGRRPTPAVASVVLGIVGIVASFVFVLVG